MKANSTYQEAAEVARIARVMIARAVSSQDLAVAYGAVASTPPIRTYQV